MSTPVLVAVAWPYASGSRHLGHLAGVYLPADIYARFQRLKGNDVLMVSGSDVHGTPITVRADTEGVAPSEIADRSHSEFCQQWNALGITFDLYTTTGTPNHTAATQEMFLSHLKKGFIYKKASEQFYDPVAERFLPDRYINGVCPHCMYEEARGDQCENCGRPLDPVDLLKPRSKITGSEPVMRSTEHFYFRFSDLSEDVAKWLRTRKGWRPHVLNSSLGWTDEGLQDRAVTRDLDWGIELPVDDLGEGKCIYVWYDAVIGYLSASKEWAAQNGDTDRWKRWWQNDDALHVYFLGKDNIPFHTLFWPAQLMAYGGLRLPDIVAGTQYVTFSGQKASASRGVGTTIGDGLKFFEPDALRYALASLMPEHADSDTSIGEIVRRINNELVATWGNLVNRVLSLAQSVLGGIFPEVNAEATIAEEDRSLLAAVDGALLVEADQIERVALKAGLRTAMETATKVNAYLNATEPWKLKSSDPERAAAVVATAVQAVAGVRIAFSPYLPFSTEALGRVFGPITEWKRPELSQGLQLAKLPPLFSKVDPATFES
ncbi:MAG: methionine--tRNA ligase [Acidimicrobiaceae bacterium]|nr:methionine--tRNA ligase [Acidimicrobiaceae bacterium]